MADDTLARAGLAALLDGQPACTVAGQVASDAFSSGGQEVYRADVVVWDLGWEPGEALDYLSQAQDNGAPVVALVADESHAAQARLVGARGVLLRDVDAPVLMTALQAVSRGLAVIQPDLEPLLHSVRDREALPSAGELTAREREVLYLMAEGLPNKTIALRLGISEHTVKFHVNAILSKLGARSRTEAVTRATRMGLILL